MIIATYSGLPNFRTTCLVDRKSLPHYSDPEEDRTSIYSTAFRVGFYFSFFLGCCYKAQYHFKVSQFFDKPNISSLAGARWTFGHAAARAVAVVEDTTHQAFLGVQAPKALIDPQKKTWIILLPMSKWPPKWDICIFSGFRLWELLSSGCPRSMKNWLRSWKTGCYARSHW